jgi:tetratricopeptide (TPR) repeat protein
MTRFRRWLALWILGATVLLAGCAAPMDWPPRPAPPEPPLPVTYLRDQALRWERADDLPRALLFWQVLVDHDPDDPEVARQVRRLRAVQRQRADGHFWEGVKAWNAGQPQQARWSWMTALRLDPAHAGARRGLETLREPPAVRVYQVQPGDSFNRIAERFYRDASKGFLVALFNDWPLEAILPEGIFLRIPVLETPAPPPPRAPRAPNQETELAQARRLFQEGELAGALETAEAILRSDPVHREALQLRDRALLGLGQGLESRGDHLGAWELIRRMDPESPGRDEAAERLQGVLRARAEEHYKNGVKFFLEEDLEKAIEEWQTALTYRPDHPQAIESLREARRLLRQLMRQP